MSRRAGAYLSGVANQQRPLVGENHPDFCSSSMGCATSIPARTDSTAERRVDQVIAQAKDNISRARRTGVILGFMLGAAALLGAAAAWYVAIATGRYRDRGESLHPLWDWGRPASV